MKILYHFGRYLMLLKKVFRQPEKMTVYRRQFLVEVEKLGLDSVWIVAIISVFMGAVLTIQMAFNIDSPLVPLYTIGFATRQSMVLEFAPTIISLILCGKVGSRIASEIGTMRVTEQIDALEVMGINSASFLILPKIMAAMFIFPFLIMMSMVLGVIGGWVAGTTTGLITSFGYIYGIQSFFHMYDVWYALTKTVVFAFIITSISAYHGYHTSGGALEVGNASTSGVVYSSIAIIFSNLILTQLLLA
ncbi:MAG: ABC transporter permease [Bacteroidetes bacterium]|nr:ABC transporter permease [Bacteroidota bacterium]